MVANPNGRIKFFWRLSSKANVMRVRPLCSFNRPFRERLRRNASTFEWEDLPLPNDIIKVLEGEITKGLDCSPNCVLPKISQRGTPGTGPGFPLQQCVRNAEYACLRLRACRQEVDGFCEENDRRLVGAAASAFGQSFFGEPLVWKWLDCPFRADNEPSRRL
jgi:hypothetical protein